MTYQVPFETSRFMTGFRQSSRLFGSAHAEQLISRRVEIVDAYTDTSFRPWRRGEDSPETLCLALQLRSVFRGFRTEP